VGDPSILLLPPLFRPEWGRGDEWQWLGQTLDATRALIVRETEPDAGALCKLFKAEKTHSWSSDGDFAGPSSDFAGAVTSEFSLWRLVPEQPGYVSLGSYAQPVTTEPKLDSEKPGVDQILNKLRGIRKDLVVQVPVQETPVNLLLRLHNGYDWSC
jgi:hypothetical protein